MNDREMIDNEMTPERTRSGAALIFILLALSLATVVFLTATKLMLIQKQTVEANAQRTQAAWLAESVERAAARLATDAKYSGETWNISAEDLGGRDGGIVAIRVNAVPRRADRRSIHVEADYPAEPDRRSRQIRDVIVNVSAEPNTGPSDPQKKGTRP